MEPVADLDGERLVASVRTIAWDLTHALANGDGDGQEAPVILSALDKTGLQALALLLADCADLRKISAICKGAHLAAVMSAWHLEEAAYRHAEFAHLRDNGVSPELAGPRVDVTCEATIAAYEAAYQAGKKRQRGEAA